MARKLVSIADLGAFHKTFLPPSGPRSPRAESRHAARMPPAGARPGWHLCRAQACPVRHREPLDPHLDPGFYWIAG